MSVVENDAGRVGVEGASQGDPPPGRVGSDDDREAVLVGVESRTSSPVRIPRDRETLQHVQTQGLYPCGEGAGYAGGIHTSAIDGENCAAAAAAWLFETRTGTACRAPAPVL